MKVVYLSRAGSGIPHPFISEQADALAQMYNIEIVHFLIKKGGISGYTSTIWELSQFIKSNKADIIHVHYGLWALIAVLNKYLFYKKVKVVITFHGSDINKWSERKLSLLAAQFASHNILVSEKMARYFKTNFTLIPCGINTDVKLIYRECTRIQNGWGDNNFVVLFCSRFDRDEKDASFAHQVIKELTSRTVKLVKFIELKGYSRDQITCLMQAADALLMCSKREGSPQVVKEAILNSLPVVSNDIGDVSSICNGADNCFIVSKNVAEYVNRLKYISETGVRIQNRISLVERFDNCHIAKKVYAIYKSALDIK
jgi:glycosyltransferase involved in cell wall biosynthesis